MFDKNRAKAQVCKVNALSALNFHLLSSLCHMCIYGNRTGELTLKKSSDNYLSCVFFSIEFLIYADIKKTLN